MTRMRGAAFALGAVLALVPVAASADDGGVSVELNKLETTGGACRAYLVLQNRSGRDFDSLKLDLVMFDRDGIVARRLAVEGAPLPAGKTGLRVFDMADQPCDGIGRVLLNDVLACGGDGGAWDDCLDLLQASSRTPAPFAK